MKLFSKIAMLAVGAAMATGVAVAASGHSLVSAGAESYSLAYTLDGTITATGNAYATASNVTQDGLSWKVVGNTEQNPWRIGGKGLTKIDRAIYSASPISADISKIEVSSGSTASSLTVNSLTISVHSSAADAESGSNEVASKSVTSDIVNKTVIFEKTDSTSWAGKYYRIVYNVTRTSTSGNGYVVFNNAKFYSIESGKEASSVSITTSKPLAVMTTDDPVQLAVSTEPNGLSLSYSSSDESVATVSSEGLVTPTGAGTATITASFAGNDDYTPSSDTITVNVSAPEPAHITGKTISQIVSEITTAGTTEPIAIYEVAGYITAWKSGESNGTQYGNFYIADTLGDTTNHAYVYGANYGNSPSWNGAKYTFSNNKSFLTNEVTSQAVIGSYVTANFMAWMYNGSTFEFQGEIKTVSNNKTLTSIELSGSPKLTFELNEPFSSDGLVVTAHYDGGLDEDVTSSAVITAPDMTSTGEKTVTVSYTYNGVTEEAEYNIEVVESITKWTISFLPGEGSGEMESVEVNEGEDYELPACTFTAPEGKVFDYWDVYGEPKTVIENVDDDYEATAMWKDAPAETTVTYNFSEVISDWSSSYAEHIVDYTEGSVTFESANKQSSTITDIPVTKGAGPVTFVGSGIYIKSATFVLRQWGSKAKTVELHYSTDGGSTYTTTGVTSDSFTITADIDTFSSTADAIKLSFGDTSSQVGIESLTITYVSSGVTYYKVTYNANGATGGSVPVDTVQYSSGDTVTVLGNVNELVRTDYTFAGWNTASDGTGDSYDEGGTFNITENVILYALWDASGGGETTAARCYTLVESESQLVAGAKYIIASGDSYSVALSTTQNSNNRGQEDITIDGNVATVTSSGVQVIELEAAGDYWAFHVSGATTGYLYAASGTSNHLKTQAVNDDNGKWTISFGEGGAATATAQGSNSHNLLQYNNSSKLFSCYLSTSTQKSVYLYRLDFEATLLHNVTCDGSSHSMPEGYTWNEDLKAVFNDLPESERLAMATAEAAADSGLERYDFIVGKYNPTGSEESDYQNFIGRSITPRGSYFGQGGLMSDNNTMIIVVTVVAITSISSIAVLLILKRRKSII